jgi:hypothetical protein
MGFRVIELGTAAHDCLEDFPSVLQYPEGTVVECTCGRKPTTRGWTK